MQKKRGVISGRVIHGNHYGKKLGFPTANLDRRSYGRTTSVFRFGIYAGTAQIASSKKVYKAAIIIGPVDRKGLPKLEVYLLSFSGHLYGKQLIATPLKFLRAFKKFKNEKELVENIHIDIQKTKKLNF